MSEKKTRPYELVDTVEVKLPALEGSEYTLFRDIANKGQRFCSLMSPRRLSAGMTFEVHRISAEMLYWGGDQELFEHLTQLATVRVQVNNTRPIYDGPLRWPLGSVVELPTPNIVITDKDDVGGFIKLPLIGHAFGTPPEKKVMEPVTETEMAELPLPKWLAEKLGLDTPFVYTHCTYKIVTRPMEARFLVSVCLRGTLTEPWGA